MEKETFFNYLKPWSKRKHRILGKYLKPFAAKVATITQNREIYCIDGFAGAAKYDDGSIGSPLMLAQLSDECSKWQNPVTLKLINIEPNNKNFSSLEYITQDWVNKGTVKNFNEKFIDAIPHILSEIRNAPAFFFVDPFGPTAVHFSHLQPILQRMQQATELFINFDTDGLQRIADASQSKSDNPKTVKSIPKNTQNVSDIIGNDEWIQTYQNKNLTTEQRQNFLLSIYINNLRKFGYAVVAYPIREALEKAAKYHMIYCTRHNDGVILMNDFMFEEENSLEEEHSNTHFPLFASAAGEQEKRRQNLCILLEQFLQNNQQTTRKQIKRQLIFAHFAEFHTKDYNAVVKDFLEDEKLKASHGKKRINDDEVLFYSK